MIRAAWAILWKDLRIELRTRESAPAMALFSLTVFVLFHFGLRRNSIDGALASGVLWVTVLLAAVLGVNRLFAAEREERALDGILLAPIDRTAIYLAKAAALFLYLVLLELIAVPAFAILLLGPGLGGAFPELLAILLVADLGLAFVGALVAGLAAEARARHRGAAPATAALRAPADRRRPGHGAVPHEPSRTAWACEMAGLYGGLRYGLSASGRRRFRLPPRGLACLHGPSSAGV